MYSERLFPLAFKTVIWFDDQEAVTRRRETYVS